MTIADALTRLRTAIAQRQLPPPAAPDDAVRELAPLAQEILPLRLPLELQALWSEIDPATLSVFHPPQLQPPSEALDMWRQRLVPGSPAPTLLLPICYESHHFYLVELSTEHREGGAVFESDFGAQTFRLLFASIEKYVDSLAALTEQGAGELHDYGDDSYFYVDEDAYSERAEQLLVRFPHPEYGAAATFPVGEPSKWPSSWR